jgi:hypothetical protein
MRGAGRKANARICAAPSPSVRPSFLGHCAALTPCRDQRPGAGLLPARTGVRVPPEGGRPPARRVDFERSAAQPTECPPGHLEHAGAAVPGGRGLGRDAVPPSPRPPAGGAQPRIPPSEACGQPDFSSALEPRGDPAFLARERSERARKEGEGVRGRPSTATPRSGWPCAATSFDGRASGRQEMTEKWGCPHAQREGIRRLQRASTSEQFPVPPRDDAQRRGKWSLVPRTTTFAPAHLWGALWRWLHK